MSENIEKKLNKIFSIVFSLKPNHIKKANLNNVKKWDSLNHLNLILAIESSFKIKINPDDSLNLVSYKKIYSFLNKIIKK